MTKPLSRQSSRILSGLGEHLTAYLNANRIDVHRRSRPAYGIGISARLRTRIKGNGTIDENTGPDYAMNSP
jgi:hypothetical protein